MLKLESLKGFNVGKHFAPKPDVTFSAVIRNAYKLYGSLLLCEYPLMRVYTEARDQRYRQGCNSKILKIMHRRNQENTEF